MIDILLGLIGIVVLVVALRHPPYNARGFNRNGIHKNGTKYDDLGYDCNGYNRHGFDRQGYNRNGYDHNGYGREGYNREGKNVKGQYNRLFDLQRREGFCNPKQYPIIVTTHAKERMFERMSIETAQDAENIAYQAYCYGRSKYQVKKSSATLIEGSESRYENSVLLLHRGYIYVFSKENKLITVYKNDRIPL